MSVCIITGAGGLIGSEAVRQFSEMGLEVVGIDNDMRAYFFGHEASTKWNIDRLKQAAPKFVNNEIDIRDRAAIFALFGKYGRDISTVIHTAAQPSHDWAAREPFTDFEINAVGTLNLLEAVRQHAPGATFIFTSTNKVYGDLPNTLPLVESDSRWELDETHDYFEFGIPETMSIDRSTHSLFGASKVSADILVQEYGRYFGIPTGVFRGGCLTGPDHSGAPLHGFLAYLMRCAISGQRYTIHGYRGKQVRDNIHAADVVRAFVRFAAEPVSAGVYNIGGGRFANCSLLEAISLCEEISGRKMNVTYSDLARTGDHIWYISDIRQLQRDFPSWSPAYSIRGILEEIHAALAQRV